jgi:HTH-like domain
MRFVPVKSSEQLTLQAVHRIRQRLVTLSLLEPDVWTGKASAYPSEPLRKKRGEIHRGSRRRNIGPLKEAGYTSAIVIAEPKPTRLLQSGGVHIHPYMVQAQWRRPICEVLPIAPATYYEHLSKRADPARPSERARRDAELRPHIQRVFDANWQVYGVRKIWRQLRREGFDVARCMVARLMKAIGIQGVIRGKPHKTTIPDKKLPCPLDKVNRQFRVPAPNMLWVSDFMP